ncbi:alpha/beta fold hydrolase [Luteimonas sp. Y-2-2-4F]|nr:alpha/beta fold hydrolase [Luteimonas sp. Y-2-2-4F]MCD9031619.1 alpha/beta fold hydrolase [Luteimonas sp. Y-2-2-4F]MCD9031806.1 alpha/beta fold hydrolase [Luteimonas sp. Y-2-2-4F]
MNAQAFEARTLSVHGTGGHRSELIARVAAAPRASLLWLPAMGVAARHYLPFAEALAARGVTVCLHEWRGHGSSSQRAGREMDWGYRALLCEDLPASEAAVEAAWPGLPRIVGGHSLGGQLACCRLALAPSAASRLWLVASGAPWWRAFAPPRRYLLPLVYRFLPWLAARRGALPGRAIGFGGNEARSLIRDWARSGLTGRYAAAGLDADLEAGLAAVRADVAAMTLDDDWLGPETSLRYLLGKLGSGAAAQIRSLDARTLGTRADHFAWMRAPTTVADALLASLDGPEADRTPPLP